MYSYILKQYLSNTDIHRRNTFGISRERKSKKHKISRAIYCTVLDITALHWESKMSRHLSSGVQFIDIERVFSQDVAKNCTLMHSVAQSCTVCIKVGKYSNSLKWHNRAELKLWATVLFSFFRTRPICVEFILENDTTPPLVAPVARVN